MKRPGITLQLFMAVFATSGLIALLVGLAAHWNFDRGFIGYLNVQAVERMDEVLPRARQVYVEHGSWDYLRTHGDIWNSQIVAIVRKGAGPGRAPRSIQEETDANASDWLGSGRRLVLLDEQRRRVIGFPFIQSNAPERPIVVDGKTVGWLAMAPIASVADAAAVRFIRAQANASLIAVVAALALATLVAWWVARTLLAPVHEVASATHRLAAGRYDTRVAVRGHDVIAQLGNDFNTLATVLERNERLRREWTSEISHELRTPLSVLKASLEAIEDGVQSMSPVTLRLLQGKVSTLVHLVEDLHGLALADAGAMAYRKVEVDLTDLVREEALAQQALYEQRGLTLDLALAASAIRVHGDPVRLRQLIQNLLGNSAQHTHRGGRVEVSVRADERSAVLAVRDSAPGVREDLLPRLTERFFRGEADVAAHPGSGLGLAICQSIAQAHDGRLSLRPSPFGGLCVEVVLPLLGPSVDR